MLSQTWVVAPVVALCFAYAGWSMAPASLRRWVAQQLLRLSLPVPLRHWAQARAVAASGCGGCGGCDHKPVARAKSGASGPAGQALIFHPPKRPVR